MNIYSPRKGLKNIIKTFTIIQQRTNILSMYFGWIGGIGVNGRE
jgi:hypothetical protein